ncbi:MAG: 3-deoxy-7-phosphoheptulonate synthase AroG [Gammaproteobacteria bacterium]|nr:3-deoxy-7-phosphoheptulonate synthase AroG [Gammaproteobacteria bacterium]
MHSTTEDLRIKEIREVISPEKLHNMCPITDDAAVTVSKGRKEVHDILHDENDRLIVVVGPCSIHDPVAAMEYAQYIKDVREQLSEQLMIVMRVYFEKPRTTVGWKGLINDPNLDDSYEINKGLHLARKLLVDISSLGVPSGTEFLDLITPQYVADLVSWGAIGARTTESQVHRELASGLSCPVGFKNGTDGTLNIAIDAVRAATRPHCFLSMTKSGHSAIFSTTGNEDSHIILRGGKQPNYNAENINAAADALNAANLNQKIMIDFSHANSRKKYQQQIEVGNDVAKQIAQGDRRIMGVMIESHLKQGRQDITAGKDMVYGQSITDACISWEQTYPLLKTLANAVKVRRG